MKARFVSRHGAYSVGIQSLIQEAYGTGESKVLKRRIDANFHHQLVTDADLAVALASLHFSGLPFDEETNSTVNPRFRLSVWDSDYALNIEGFTQDEVDRTIEKLRLLGGNGGEYVEVPAVEVTAPWPGYDEMTDINLIAQLIRATKIDPESVIAYEEDNANRSDLIDLLRDKSEVEGVVIEA